MVGMERIMYEGSVDGRGRGGKGRRQTSEDEVERWLDSLKKNVSAQDGEGTSSGSHTRPSHTGKQASRTHTHKWRSAARGVPLVDLHPHPPPTHPPTNVLYVDTREALAEHIPQEHANVLQWRRGGGGLQVCVMVH